MFRRLGRRDFSWPTLRVARDLLGKFIVRRYRGRLVQAMIAETEAYQGPQDLASHAAGGRRTARVEPLYGDGGTVSKEMWLEDRGVRVAAKYVSTGPRVGVAYAGPYWAARPWRFRITNLLMQAGIR